MMAAMNRHPVVWFAFLIPLIGCSLFSESDSDVSSEARWGPAAKPAAAPEGPAPRLVIENDACDFGTGAIGQWVTGDYQIRNEGDALLKVRLAGCGAHSWHEFAPGESDTFEVRCDLSGKERPLDHRIWLCTNDPARPKAMVRLQGNVIELYETDPPLRRGVHFGNVIRDVPAGKVMEVEAALGRRLHLKLTPRQDMHFDATLAELEAGRRYRLSVSTKPTSADGYVNSQITLETGLESVPQLHFPVTAKFHPRVFVTNRSITLRPNRRWAGKWAIRLCYSREKPVHVTDVRMAQQKLPFEVQAPRPGGGDWAVFDLVLLVAQVAPSIDIPVEGATLEIHTDDPEFPILELPITKKRPTQHSPSK